MVLKNTFLHAKLFLGFYSFPSLWKNREQWCVCVCKCYYQLNAFGCFDSVHKNEGVRWLTCYLCAVICVGLNHVWILQFWLCFHFNSVWINWVGFEFPFFLLNLYFFQIYCSGCFAAWCDWLYACYILFVSKGQACA